MKSPILLALLLIPALLLVACDEQPHKPPVPHTNDAKQGAGLFQDQRNALDKAKGVQGVVDQQDQQQREALDKQEK